MADEITPNSPQWQNVCFTWNNPGEDPIPFDVEQMHYLVYQLEVGENGTEHYQGYVEFKKRLRIHQMKALFGNNTIHFERRRGTAKQASDYCKKNDTRKEGHTFVEFGEMKETNPGSRKDLELFKDAVMSGQKRKRDLIDEHFGTLARYPKFYDLLKSVSRPTRAEGETLEVILHIGPTGLGKTKKVYDEHGDDPELYATPLSNGTPWYDGYDGHKIVLLDDFAGSASHLQLVTLLRLLDRYPVQVPIKGSHVWWFPNRIYVTTNIEPAKWYKWEGRERQYLALARRFTKVIEFYEPLHEDDQGYTIQGPEWWKDNAPVEAMIHYSQ